MKRLFILLVMLTPFPGLAAESTPADTNPPSQTTDNTAAGNTSQSADSDTKSGKDEKPKQEDEEEEPDCD